MLESGVDKRVVFQKGGFGGCSPRTKTGTSVHSDVSPGTKTATRVRSHVPPERKPERGHIRQNHPFRRLPFFGKFLMGLVYTGSEEFSHFLRFFCFSLLFCFFFRFSSFFCFSSFFSFVFVFLRFSLILLEDKGEQLQFTAKMGNFTPTPSAPTPCATSRLLSPNETSVYVYCCFGPLSLGIGRPYCPDTRRWKSLGCRA